MGDELVDLFERAGVEQQVDAFTSGQFAGGVLAFDALGAAASFRSPFEVVEEVFRIHAFTACDFSQSFRNFSRPMFVSG